GAGAGRGDRGGGLARKFGPRPRPWAAGGNPTPPPVLPASAQSRSPPPANPAASGRSNSMSRRLGAPHRARRRQAQTPPRRSPASARCSTVAAARGPPVPQRSPLHPSLEPVQTPVFAPILTSPISSQIARRPSPDGYAMGETRRFQPFGDKREICGVQSAELFIRAR